ncbi:sensor domain-containing diguanylate cyclase [Achromobacter insolitus]|uniref:diguanylate cyclase n=1 Tax=Achromobacter insolitus TaxID=217204 RepID=A0A6S7F4Z0_9BURK|nr:sensor domain-containing diguanylate cyclase [Achromobacter insolitus]GLK93574.1 cell signaling regulator [Achromobacter xylosoxidans]MCP1403352.1 diguanylate cyclase (GGDEF)-like protein [Achromobacter insolitus]MDQ6216433.1 sensor domain-containing diguanylate cyclase [Achromobacter insolitus]NGT15341.1 GGDEF domain-containing protein [Achromobacter insolitus]QEK93153.1 GGDEF domain-containing protein [Achromobacter insolitus]
MRINLRGLVLALTVFSALAATANALYASYRVQREQLIANTLESNRVYAAKLAESADSFLDSALQQLEYSARHVAGRFDAPELLNTEVSRLREQTASFNSVAIVRADGIIVAASQGIRSYQGTRVDNAGSRVALQTRKPLISKPYVSIAGNLLINVSYPIHSDSGAYLGYVSGTIYLRNDGALHTLLGRHPYQDGSYLYVVDGDGRLIYHADNDRVGEDVSSNPVVGAVTRGEHGAQRLINTRGVDMLAGYAPVPRSGWGVIAQRPAQATLEPLHDLIWALVRYAAPFSLLFLLAIWWCARKISQPLSQLATNVEHHDMAVAMQRVRSVKAWYFEAQRLKRAVIRSYTNLQDKIGKLNQASITDPLTGLRNRRGTRQAVDTLQAADTPFAVVALDIDHFKRVNDTYGHTAGDEVIQGMAQLMRDCSRPTDVLCRNGGEEFLILLPGAGAKEAAGMAERLRLKTEARRLSGALEITVSAGVAQWPAGGADVEKVFQAADAALYAAKQQGRNRVVIHAA